MPRMDEPLAVQALGHARLLQQRDRALLQHAGADAAEHVFAAPPLQHDVGDAVKVQQPREQQPRGPGSDDGDLRVQGRPPAGGATGLLGRLRRMVGVPR